MTLPRSLPVLAFLTASCLAMGCDPDLGEEAAAPPDTAVQEEGAEAARAFCRQLIRDRLGMSRERVAIQEDGLVRSRGTGRFDSDGLARILGEDARTTEALYRFDCTVRHDDATGWVEERLDLRRVRRGGDESASGAGAEAAGG